MGHPLSEHKRNYSILKNLKRSSLNKLASCQQTGRHQIPETNPRLSNYRKTKTWTTIRQTTRRI